MGEMRSFALRIFISTRETALVPKSPPRTLARREIFCLDFSDNGNLLCDLEHWPG